MAGSNKKSIATIFKDYDEMVDKDFSGLRKRFDTEIRQVEAEMDRFRSELLDKNGNFLHNGMKPRDVMEHTASKSHDIATISPPSIQKDGNRNVMKLRFDVSHFPPEEVSVSADDEKLSVHAQHQQKLGNKTIYRESNREFPLPKGVKPDSIRSTVTRDGVLTVNAPLPNMPVSSKYHRSLAKP